jgi:hypothetical protein
MYYKLYVDDSVSEEDVIIYWESLQLIIDASENINYAQHNEPFIAEGNTIMLIDSEWGYKRPQTADIEELSVLYPDETFYLIQASRILNGDHFEQLKQYSLSEFTDGHIRRILKPKPIEWELSREFKQLDPWA